MYSQSFKIFNFLDDSLIPFIIICSINFGMELIASIARALEGGEAFIFMSAIFLILTSLTIVIFYFIYGYLILKKLAAVFGEGTSVIKKISIRLMMSGVFVLLMIIFIVLMVTPIFDDPIGYYILFFGAYATLNLISACQIYACIPTRSKKSTKNSQKLSLESKKISQGSQ